MPESTTTPRSYVARDRRALKMVRTMPRLIREQLTRDLLWILNYRISKRYHPKLYLLASVMDIREELFARPMGRSIIRRVYGDVDLSRGLTKLIQEQGTDSSMVGYHLTLITEGLLASLISSGLVLKALGAKRVQDTFFITQSGRRMVHDSQS